MKTAFLSFLIPLLVPVQACLTRDEIRGGHIVDLTKGINRRQTDGNVGTIPVATGDRFQNGDKAPRGIGSQAATVLGTFNSVLNTNEIKSAIKGLEKEFRVGYFETPYKTFENRTMFGAKVGGTGKSNNGYRVLLETGIHARERGGPDHLIYFISDLLWANREKKGLNYGGVSYTYKDVQTALGMGIVVLPLVNPDGVAFDQTTNSCWRKNRNPASAISGDPHSIGIDLNRNFAPVWNFTKYLAPGIEAASTNASTETFYGTGPLSEPETKNVDWTMDRFPNLGWFMDQHSPATLVLYGWCHDSNQARDPTQNFGNMAYDGKRGVVPDEPSKGTAYKEYLDQKDWDILSLTAARIAGGMSDSTGRFYPALQAPHLYPSSGCSADHGYMKAMLDPSKKKIYGFGVEFGEWNEDAECGFYPTVEAHGKNMVENGVAYMELLLNAARLS
ncbi:zinc carboxypeptidase [Bombardia bombarda]|uniref:Zinc carboxypeptidase n=1 Tax=Bombardia bombarda TaxID=252184 RepID=A0AA39WUW5_9PEZI|nr:zinc carboxypeptidase [Bombardia bombarda]